VGNSTKVGNATEMAQEIAHTVVQRSLEEIAQLPVVLQRLKIEGMPRWEELSEIMLPNDIQDFGHEVKTWGLEYRLSELIEWGEAIEHYAGSFLIEELGQILKRFPDVIQWVEGEIEAVKEAGTSS